jgi:hypothetical protein
MPNDPDNDALARGMIEVHGTEAAGIARANARTAALGGAIVMAKRWIQVLTEIQRQQRVVPARPERINSGEIG